MRPASTPPTESDAQRGEGDPEVALEGEVEQRVDGGVEVGRPVRVLVQVGGDAVETIGADGPEETEGQPTQHEGGDDGTERLQTPDVTSTSLLLTLHHYRVQGIGTWRAGHGQGVDGRHGGFGRARGRRRGGDLVLMRVGDDAEPIAQPVDAHDVDDGDERER